MNKSTITKQVTVVGGGPAGSALSISLLKLGISVSIIEKSNYDDFRVGEHLYPNTIPQLSRLNVLELVKTDDHVRCHGIKSAWGSSDIEYKDYVLNPYGEGFNLSRPKFDAQLARHAKEEGALVLCNSKIENLGFKDSKWIVSLKVNNDELILKSDFLVDAAGRTSRIAKKLGGGRTTYDNLIGIVGLISNDLSYSNEDNSLLLEACEDGWWYSLGLARGRLIGTYMTDADIISESKYQPKDFWLNRLYQSKYTKNRLKPYLDSNLRIHVRSARSQVLKKFVGPNWLAVGDACMSLDPLSSAGIANGLRWGILAAKSIKLYLSGDSSALSEYEEEGKQEFNFYLQDRWQFYTMENRWASSTFWKRRHRMPD